MRRDDVRFSGCSLLSGPLGVGPCLDLFGSLLRPRSQCPLSGVPRFKVGVRGFGYPIPAICRTTPPGLLMTTLL